MGDLLILYVGEIGPKRSTSFLGRGPSRGRGEKAPRPHDASGYHARGGRVAGSPRWEHRKGVTGGGIKPEKIQQYLPSLKAGAKSFLPNGGWKTHWGLQAVAV